MAGTHALETFEKNKVKILLSFLVLIPLAAFNQLRPVDGGFSYTGINTYSSHHAGAFFENPAALASVKSLSAGIYSERKFMMPELSLYRLSIAVSGSAGHFGLGLDRSGSALYHESLMSFSYARRMGKLDAGVEFNYFNLATAGYGNGSAVYFGVGAIYQATEKLRTGFFLSNPTRSGFDKDAQARLPVCFGLGFGFEPSKKFLLAADIRKYGSLKADLNLGIQYFFDEKLLLRAGLTATLSQFHFGTGVMLKGFRIEATAAVHQQLGLTPGLMFIYQKPGEK